MISFVHSIFQKNRLLAIVGSVHLILSLILLLLIPFWETEVLGINSLIKPLKFAISIWMYCWSFALILHYLQNPKMVRRFSIVVAFTMLFEQGVITVQSFRGTLSHFNNSTIVESILFNLMGVFITVLTIYSLVIAIRLKRQKDSMNAGLKEAIFWGIVIMVVASFIGGVMGALNTHQVGGEMGEEGLKFVNWSTKHGDLRIAHFVGIHALQIIPLLGYLLIQRNWKEQRIIRIVRITSMVYFLIVTFALTQAIMGQPLISL